LLVIVNGGENFYGGGNRDTWNKNNDKRHHIHLINYTSNTYFEVWWQAVTIWWPRSYPSLIDIFLCNLFVSRYWGFDIGFRPVVRCTRYKMYMMPFVIIFISGIPVSTTIKVFTTIYNDQQDNWNIDDND
jgi:hypothetical protein